MKPIPLIRLNMIAPIIQFLEGMGSPIEKRMEQVNVPLAALATPETPLPVMMLLQFIHQAADREGIENLGVAMHDAVSITDTGMFGALISQSFTLYEALKRTCEISRLAMSEAGDKVWLIEEAEQVWFCQSFPFYQPRDVYINHSIFYSLLLQLSVVRRALGDRWQPLELHLPTAPCPTLAATAQLWDTRVHYYKPFTAIQIPRDVLATPMVQTPASRATAEQSDLQTWQATAPALDFVGSLEQTLSTLLLEGYPSIELTAEAIATSVRSLQRSLSQQGLTYSRVMDKVRYQKAMSIMQDPEVPLIEVAYALGYSDPSNFSHAFKRWTGVTPRRFRQHHASQRYEWRDNYLTPPRTTQTSAEVSYS
jgi:AraC-like DNA-binding protein